MATERDLKIAEAAQKAGFGYYHSSGTYHISTRLVSMLSDFLAAIQPEPVSVPDDVMAAFEKWLTRNVWVSSGHECARAAWEACFELFGNAEQVSVPEGVLISEDLLRQAIGWIEDRRRYGDEGTLHQTWFDLKTMQKAAIAAAPQAVCQTCNGRGEVGGHVGQTPEQFDYVTEPCQDCSQQPAQALTDAEIHAALLQAVAEAKDGGDTPEPPNLYDFVHDPRYAGTLEFTRAFASAILSAAKGGA